MKKRYHKISKTTTEWISNQRPSKEDWKTPSANIDMNLLAKTFDNSFLLGGIISKIGSSANSWLKEIKNTNLKNLLSDLDFEYCFKSYSNFWNLFLEKVKNTTWKVVGLKPFITTTVKIIVEDGKISKYKQEIWWNVSWVDFLPEDVWHIKRTSLTNYYWWDSIFNNCVTQIALLQEIDLFYQNLFNDWLISSIILWIEDWETSEEERKELQDTIKHTMRWKDNSLSALVWEGKISKIDLMNNFRTEDFLTYRNDLIKSISIATNIPYWMLINDSSNRSTSDTEKKVFNELIIWPLQQSFLKQLKSIIKTIPEFEKDDLSELDFDYIDIKNQKEESEILTSYVEKGIYTPNEARIYLGLPKINDISADQLRNNKLTIPSADQLDKVKKEIEESVSNIYK